MSYSVRKAMRGGMGFVLLLRRDKKSPGRLGGLRFALALKTVLSDATDNNVALFKRELTIWAAFRHPNIVYLHEILDGGTDGWIAAMDWCPGSLRELISQRQTFSLEETASIIYDVLNGLDYVYNQDQILHLDLKPENILYDLDCNKKAKDKNNPLQTSRFMVSDWGIASIKQPRLNAIAGLPPSCDAAKQTFNNIGTLLYMAPERFQKGFHSSVASDVFSLGMIYLELLAGSLPFGKRVNPVESLVSGLYQKDAQVLMARALIPRSICRIIHSMIDPVSRNRPNTYAALRASLIKSNNRSKSVFARIFN